MKTLNLTLKGIGKLSPTVMVDNKSLNFKKNVFGNYTTTFQTDKNEVELAIINYLEISGKFWFLMGLFFFLISLFGIFDMRVSKNCLVIKSRFKIYLDSNVTNFEAQINDKNGEKGISYNCNDKVEEIENICYEDLVAKKRRKILFVTKILLWIVLTVLSIILLVKNL